MLDKKIKISKYIAIFSILAFFLVLGISYATVVWTTSDYNIALNSACFKVNYVGGQDIERSLSTIDESTYIVDNTITMGARMAFTSVSIELDEDCENVYGKATIKANVTSLPNIFKSGGNAYNKLKYVVAEYDPTDYSELTMGELEGDTFNIVTTGYINNTGTKDLYRKFMESGELNNYLIIFYVQNPGVLITGSFGATIDAEVVQNPPTSINDFDYSIGTYTPDKGDAVSLPEGQILLTHYNGSNTIVNVPSTYTVAGVEYSVAILSNNCFYNNSSITEVNFADNILLRTEDANNSAEHLFDGCTALINAPVIPSSVTNMGYTFNGCTSLVNAPVIIGSVTDMSYTFYDCTSLVTVPTIPSSVTDMSYTFKGCTSLATTPTIPSSVTNMSYTFKDCTSLVTAPTIPSSVTNMQGTFYGCTSLVNAPVILGSVTYMNDTFNGCTSLVTAPTIPSSVTNMNYTFNGCTSLVTAPTIPSSVTNMTRTFKGCTNLIGTVRINSSSVTRDSGSTYHPFYGTTTTKGITVEVPSGSTTYTNINSNKPVNVTIVQY